MVSVKPTILHLTPFFSPNIGGVETHLLDLTNQLSHRRYLNIVLTYSPLVTSTTYLRSETVNPYLSIRRFRWFGHNLFHKLEKHPLLNLLYLTPYLFFRACFWLVIHRSRFDIVHSHGISAAICGILIKHLFRSSQHIVSIYSSYDNVPLGNISTRIMVSILNQCDYVLTQSDRATTQLSQLGVNPDKLRRYRHWIDTTRFSPDPIPHPRPVVLFVGRLIPGKNSLSLANCARHFPDINFNFVGTGPDLIQLQEKSKHFNNIHLIGDVPYSQLHFQYQSADIFCIPSTYDEGWGRVVMEAVACGLPVIASNSGAISEVVDHTVSLIISPTTPNLVRAIKLLTSPTTLNTFRKHCRPYALRHFSVRNLSLITRLYIKT